MALPAAAQDAHYWTDQLGARSDLLGGLVVGDVSDPSAAFYNPGALGVVEEPAFLISASGFQNVWLTIDGVGLDPDLRARRADVVPDFIAGDLPFDWLGRSRFSYSGFTRTRQRLDLVGRRVDPYEAVASGQDSIGLALQAQLDHRVSETWAGLTWGYPLGSGLGVGVTTFVAVRSQNTVTLRSDQAFDDTPGLASSFVSRDLGYTTWRLLWKAGVQYRTGRWWLGGTVTTPGLHVTGSGSLAANSTAQASGVADPEDPFLLATDQRSRPARYRSGWAVAAGATYTFSRGALLGTVEWFGPVAPYDVVDTDPVRSQTSGEQFELPVVSELESVVNAGLGVEWRFSPDVTGYASARTDVSAAPPERNTVNLSTWDLYHFSAGAEVAWRTIELTLGLGLGVGSETLDPLAPESRTLDALLPPLPAGELSYVRLRGLLGFQYFFGRGPGSDEDAEDGGTR